MVKVNQCEACRQETDELRAVVIADKVWELCKACKDER